MKNVQSKSERTRAFIIESTAEIFNKKGYAGTSLSNLTAATGLSKGAIYCNFENKEEVALAAFDYNYARISQATREQVDQAKTYHDKLMVYTRVYRNVIGKMSKWGGCPILNTAIEADDTNSVLKERAAKAVHAWENRLVKLIEQGIIAGEFKPGVNARQTALSIVALIEGGLMISKVTDDRSSMDSVLNTVELLINNMEK
ncbi:MAG: TetR family transcriptional regulator [Mucilaginibacter sp.]|nr:TetR family transcriptional regulator [Mucilaginibacter sp.]